MTGQPIWMVRAGKNAAYVEDFLEGSFVAIGFHAAGDIVEPIDPDELGHRIAESNPTLSPGQVSSIASQVKRFYEELAVGDAVMTYDPSQRLYFVSKIVSDVQPRQHFLSRSRSVHWTHQVSRDALGASTRNTLGAIQTLFQVRDEAATEVWERAVGIGQSSSQALPAPEPVATGAAETDDDIESRASELIDDAIASLAWDQLQELIAEILGAMGYRAEVSSKGPDRGVDIFASPDGLGLQAPRIFVEVKHQLGTKIGSNPIRAFLGGRQQGDRCLYVSTGGFTKEARYEAERSSIPITLIALPKLRELLLEHYQSFSPSGLALIPLKRIYWPAG